MWWYFFHLTHILITATCSAYSKSNRNIYNASALVVWWALHQLHNLPHQVDTEKIYQTMGIYLLLTVVFWWTQGRHWSTAYLAATGAAVVGLTYFGSEWTYYKDASGLMFFAASMVILWTSTNLKSYFSR